MKWFSKKEIIFFEEKRMPSKYVYWMNFTLECKYILMNSTSSHKSLNIWWKRCFIITVFDIVFIFFVYCWFWYLASLNQCIKEFADITLNHPKYLLTPRSKMSTIIFNQAKLRMLQLFNWARRAKWAYVVEFVAL